MAKRVVIVIFLIMFVLILSAELSSVGPGLGWNPGFQLGGLLNPDRISMNHTMSFVSGISSTGDGFYQSSYTNHIRMQLRENLRFNVDLTVMNLGTMSHDNNFNISANDDNRNVILPAVSLEFRPRDNVIINFEYRRVQGNYFQQRHHNRHFWDGW
jgi:hypothetical protein